MLSGLRSLGPWRHISSISMIPLVKVDGGSWSSYQVLSAHIFGSHLRGRELILEPSMSDHRLST